MRQSDNQTGRLGEPDGSATLIQWVLGPETPQWIVRSRAASTAEFAVETWLPADSIVVTAIWVMR